MAAGKTGIMVSMIKRPSLVVALALAVVALLALWMRSAEARGDGGDNLYRCHLDEDSACTIVRQTGRNLVVVTYRPVGAAPDAGPIWSVVITDAAGATQTPRPGTVTIVPVDAPSAARAAPPVSTTPPPFASSPPPVGPALPNSAPIIE